MIELDRHKFREYLNKLDGRAVVGITCHCLYCPIARYLRSVYPNGDWSIDSHTIDDLSQSKIHVRFTPRWARVFIGECDRSSSDGPSQKVEAREAIEYLNFTEKKIRYDKEALQANGV